MAVQAIAPWTLSPLALEPPLFVGGLPGAGGTVVTIRLTGPGPQPVFERQVMEAAAVRVADTEAEAVPDFSSQPDLVAYRRLKAQAADATAKARAAAEQVAILERRTDQCLLDGTDAAPIARQLAKFRAEQSDAHTMSERAGRLADEARARALSAWTLAVADGRRAARQQAEDRLRSLWSELAELLGEQALDVLAAQQAAADLARREALPPPALPE